MRKTFAFSLVALLVGSAVSVITVSDFATAKDLIQTQTPRNPTPASRSMSRSTEVDKPFIEMMIPHHQSASEMAQMALSRAKSPEVKKLAQKIIQEQTREISEMQTYYKQWYGTEPPMKGMQMSMSGMGQPMMMSMQQQQMMSQEMMQALRSAPNFDQEFLQQMTRHHQMATMMAGMVVDSARHPEIRTLARNIVRSQNEEIAQMKQLQLQASTR